MTTEHKPHSSQQLHAYAESSKAFTHGEKTEDELLQRIWNLAGDVTGLIEQLEAREKQLIEIAQKGYERVMQGEYERVLEQLQSLEREAEIQNDEADRLHEQLEAARREIARLKSDRGMWHHEPNPAKERP